MSTIPSRHTAKAIERYLPYFEIVARNHPNVVVINPAPLTCDTFSCRFRDAVAGVIRFGQRPELRGLVDTFASDYSVANVKGTGNLVIGSREEVRKFGKADTAVGSIVDANIAQMDTIDSPSDAIIRALVTLIQAGILEHATLTGATIEQVQKLIPTTGRPVEVMDHNGTLTLI